MAIGVVLLLLGIFYWSSSLRRGGAGPLSSALIPAIGVWVWGPVLFVAAIPLGSRVEWVT